MQIVTDLMPSFSEERFLPRCEGRQHLLRLREEAIAEARELVSPAAIYDLVAVERVDSERLVLSDGQIIESELIAELFASAEEIALAVSTIGQGLEKRVSQYLEQGKLSRAMMLDRVGTGAIGELHQGMRARFSELAQGKGLKASFPLSPGHAHWGLEQQSVLFDILPAAQIGVTLTDSYLMLPLKSTSMIVGLGPEVPVEGAQCDYCPRRESCPASQWHNRAQRQQSQGG